MDGLQLGALYAHGPSCIWAWGKSRGGGNCGRGGQRQSLGLVVLRQPSRMTSPSLSKAMTAVSVTSTRRPTSTKGASPMREWGKPAMTWPFELAGGRAVHRCKFATCNGLHRGAVGNADSTKSVLPGRSGCSNADTATQNTSHLLVMPRLPFFSVLSNREDCFGMRVENSNKSWLFS